MVVSGDLRHVRWEIRIFQREENFREKKLSERRKYRKCTRRSQLNLEPEQHTVEHAADKMASVEEVKSTETAEKTVVPVLTTERAVEDALDIAEAFRAGEIRDSAHIQDAMFALVPIVEAALLYFKGPGKEHQDMLRMDFRKANVLAEEAINARKALAIAEEWDNEHSDSTRMRALEIAAHEHAELDTITSFSKRMRE